MKTYVKQSIKGYLLSAPALILLLIFIIVPFFLAFKLSLYRSDGLGINMFVGFKNFIDIFKDPNFYKTLKPLCIFAISIPLVTILPLIGAKLVYSIKSDKAAFIFRVVFVITMAVPGMVVMLIWKQMYYANNGAINELLRVIGLGSMARGWLGDPTTVVYAVVFMGVPWVQGLNFLIYLTGYMKIPKDYYEAARIEGASWYDIMKSIEIPMLRPQIFMVLTLAVVGVFQLYEPFLVMTQGGPAGSSTVPALYLFQNAFQYGKFGYATAIGVLIFVICLVLTLINKLVLIRKD
jgi:raffinose/stachyose/melibiose transport system permease protein